MKSFLLTTALVVSVAAAGWAQAPASTGPTPQAGPTAIPLDGGASLLLAGGVAYGLRKLRKRQARP